MAVFDIVNISVVKMSRFQKFCFAVLMRSGKSGAVTKRNPSVQRAIAWIMVCVWLISLC